MRILFDLLNVNGALLIALLALGTLAYEVAPIIRHLNNSAAQAVEILHQNDGE